MHQIQVKIATSAQRTTYPIFVGADLLGQIAQQLDLKGYTKIGVLTDNNVAPLWGSQLSQGLGRPVFQIEIPAGESAKSLSTLSGVWNEFQRLGFDRRSLLVNLGGGVVGDLGGLAASTYMRGLDFVQVPTTLLAQVDASVGGKLAINFGEVKNLIGVFNQPLAVVIDVQTLRTLPERELKAGFAEVIKHGLIRDRLYLEQISGCNPKALKQSEYLEIVRRSCEIKAEVVGLDEKESGLRKILNFGHTLGHALEIMSQNCASEPEKLLHGEAVALGLLAEARLSQLCNLLSKEEVQLVREILGNYGLPLKVSLPAPAAAIIEKLQSDKKNVGGKVKWTLLKTIGEAVYDCEAESSAVVEALSEVLA